MAGEVTTAREGRVNPINGIGIRTRAYTPIFGRAAQGSERQRYEYAINQRAESLMRRYASWDNPLVASDWNIRNAERIGRAVGRMLR